MSLEERTLVVRNLDAATGRASCLDPRITRELLQELFIQSGPVANVVLRPDHAFIEFTHEASVAYALALLDGTRLFGTPLALALRTQSQHGYRYVQVLTAFADAIRANPDHFRRYLTPEQNREQYQHHQRSQYSTPQHSRYPARHHQYNDRDYRHEDRDYRHEDRDYRYDDRYRY